MIEFQILKHLCTAKDNYLRYRKSLNTKYLKDNFVFLSKILNVIDIIYTKHDNTSITKGDLESVYLASYPVLKDGDRRELSSILDRIFTTEVSEHLLTSLLETYNLRAGAAALATVALEVHDGKKGLEALQKAYAALEAPAEGGDSLEFVEDDLEALYSSTAGGPGITLPLSCLQRSLGPLRTGNMGVIFGRPEQGKTTLLSQIATHAVLQVEKPIIWFNNEQPGAEVKIRLYQSMFGVTVKELFENRPKYNELYRQQTKGLLLLLDNAIIDKETVERVMKDKQPSLVIFDQLDKIYGFTNDRYDLELGQRYQWARELAKLYCPVIGVCQASAEAESVKYLTMDHMSNSKTSKAAEADWILGIGASAGDDFKWYRYFNISKNKLLGDANTDPTLRHGSFQTILEPELGRYKEI